jgi:hypothetical protein
MLNVEEITQSFLQNGWTPSRYTEANPYSGFFYKKNLCGRYALVKNEKRLAVLNHDEPNSVYTLKCSYFFDTFNFRWMYRTKGDELVSSYVPSDVPTEVFIRSLQIRDELEKLLDV